VVAGEEGFEPSTF